MHIELMNFLKRKVNASQRKTLTTFEKCQKETFQSIWVQNQ